jgi:hypothetical protein
MVLLRHLFLKKNKRKTKRNLRVKMYSRKRIEREEGNDEITPSEFRRCDLCDFIGLNVTRIHTSTGNTLDLDRHCLGHIHGVTCDKNGCDFCSKHPEWIGWKKEGELFVVPDSLAKVMADLHRSQQEATVAWLACRSDLGRFCG